MDATELNQKLNALLISAVRDGVTAGKMSSAAAVGILEFHRAEFIDTLRLLGREAAARAQPRIVLPAPKRPWG